MHLAENSKVTLFTWGEFLLGKLRQLFVTTHRYRRTAVPPSVGLPAAGLVSPFTSFQGIFHLAAENLWNQEGI
jgi:hypothetical protein